MPSLKWLSRDTLASLEGALVSRVLAVREAKKTRQPHISAAHKQYKNVGICFPTWQDANAGTFIWVSTNSILTSDKGKQGSLASF